MATVLRNTFFLTTASVLQKALSFLFFFFLARHFGAAGAGAFTYSLAFTTLFAIFVDAGLTSVLIREVAREVGRARHFLRAILRLKLVFAAVVLPILYTVLYFSQTAHSVWPLIVAASLVMLMDSLNLTLYGTVRAHQDLRWESAGILLAQIISFSIGLATIYFNGPLVWMVIGLGIGSGAHAILGLVALRHCRLAQEGEAPERAFLLREAVPFGLAGIFARGYSFLDSILLGQLAGLSVVGVYSAANKFAFAFQFVPLTLTGSLYPAFSKMLGEDKVPEARALWLKSEKYLLLVSMPLVAVIIAWSGRLLHLYGDDFVAGQHALWILAPSLIFSFLSYPVGALLNAAGLQKWQTKAMGATLVVNAVVNVALIPVFGAVGAAVAAFCGNLTLFSTGLFWAHKKAVKLPLVELAQAAAVVAVVACLVGWGAWALQAHFGAIKIAGHSF